MFYLFKRVRPSIVHHLSWVRVDLRRMSAQAIREATGKHIINRHLAKGSAVESRFASIDPETDFSSVVSKNPWLSTEKLVVKPDQLIKRRGKLGLPF